MSRFLIAFGILLVAAGLLWPLLQKVGLGRLPGDIVIERGGFRLYLPIATSIVMSMLLSLVLWLINSLSHWGTYPNAQDRARPP